MREANLVGSLRAAAARPEAQRLPLLADPAHPPSADDEREAPVVTDEEIGLAVCGLIGVRLNYEQQGSGPDALALIDLASKVCIDYGNQRRLLDAARLALSGAQKEVALRDAEIKRLKEQVAALHETCRSDIRTMGVLHKTIDDLRDLVSLSQR